MALVKGLLVFFFVILVVEARAGCFVRNSDGRRTNPQGDAFYRVLEKQRECPESVHALRLTLNQSSLVSIPYMVANRGIHNPTLGSFSIFEEVRGLSPELSRAVGIGEFFFGHFTTVKNGLVVTDQEPAPGQLLVELLAWDGEKNLFNFYELIGTGTGARWFYRGDSKDILADNARLYLSPQGPQFGSTLRCSACHSSGGPIMKELSGPHNDWWTFDRPLGFAPNSLSDDVANWVKSLGDASELSTSVKAGIARLEESLEYQRAKQGFSIKATLRPLFCETEINLESDVSPLEVTSAIQIPSASIVNPILAKASLNLRVAEYKALLRTFKMEFPETRREDADHGWLVPVKGYSDLSAIEGLIKRGVISEEFVADVLAIDFDNPLFSPVRCGLLRLVPEEGLAHFPDELKSSTLAGARELYENLTDPVKTKDYHARRAQSLLDETQRELQTLDGRTRLFRSLLAKRKAVRDSEISKNPRGQILEPGFRVIFPRGYQVPNGNAGRHMTVSFGKQRNGR